MTVIHWFRRDLRLEDNTALIAALRSGEQVVPVFLFDPAILQSPRTGAPRLAFMLKALTALDQSLRSVGGRLVIQQGNPVNVLPQLVRDVAASAVFANRDYSPYARRRDRAVEQALTVPLHRFDDAVLHAPGTVMKTDGEPYVVFTPFMRQWRDLISPPQPDKLTLHENMFSAREFISGEALPTLGDLGRDSTIVVPEASAGYARQRLAAFVDGPIYAYSETRNRLVNDPFSEHTPSATSTLSPYLRLGLLSPRQVYWAAQRALRSAPDDTARKAVNVWINELIWREFYMHILYHFPHVISGNFRVQYDRLQWRDAPDELAVWKHGRTGYPIVDAAMRQLMHIGWMPNRARMIVASFLTKDLLIDWREGELHFMQWLIDGDPAANNGGWQWAAGTGTDAQPYFRIFNPVSQSKQHDPDADYIRHWIPELRDVPTKYIHTPWKMETPPSDYPVPMVDHSIARERTLAAFKAAKG